MNPRIEWTIRSGSRHDLVLWRDAFTHHVYGTGPCEWCDKWLTDVQAKWDKDESGFILDCGCTEQNH